MVTTNYENDIVFARFLKYIKKALSNRRNNYMNSKTLRIVEIFVSDKEWEIISDTTIDYSFEDNLDIFKLSYNPAYIKKLYLALDTLSHKQKLVIKYYYYKDMTNKEIADKMSITLNAVEKLKMRALERLRCIFSEEIKNEMGV